MFLECGQGGRLVHKALDFDARGRGSHPESCLWLGLGGKSTLVKFGNDRGFCEMLINALISRFQDLYCHIHNSYMEAVVGNEILKFQAPSSNAQKMYKENHTSKRRS